MKSYETEVADFSFAAPAAGEALALVVPPLLAGMLAYMSPTK